MVGFIIKRILSVLPVLLGISFIAFGMTFLAPGDPAELVLDQSEIYFPSAEQVEALRIELGLDKPWYVQYFHWLQQAMHGNLGTSYRTGNEVLAELQGRLPITLVLAFMALILSGAGGIGLGFFSVVKRGTLLDKMLQSGLDFLLSMPSFLMALLFILVVGEFLRILPTNGVEGFDGYFLPAVSLSFSTLAMVARLTKNKLLEELGKTYCLVALAHGISTRRIIFFYALPNAIFPVLALLGNFFGGVLGGTVVIETIFSLHGIGSLALEAIKFRDYPLLQGYVLFTGCTFVFVSLGIDLLLYCLNPKVKFEDHVG